MCQCTYVRFKSDRVGWNLTLFYRKKNKLEFTIKNIVFLFFTSACQNKCYMYIYKEQNKQSQSFEQIHKKAQRVYVHMVHSCQLTIVPIWACHCLCALLSCCSVPGCTMHTHQVALQSPPPFWHCFILYPSLHPHCCSLFSLLCNLLLLFFYSRGSSESMSSTTPHPIILLDPAVLIRVY